MTQERGRRKGQRDSSQEEAAAPLTVLMSASVSLQQLESFYHSKVTAAAHVTQI